MLSRTFALNILCLQLGWSILVVVGDNDHINSDIKKIKLTLNIKLIDTMMDRILYLLNSVNPVKIATLIFTQSTTI